MPPDGWYRSRKVRRNAVLKFEWNALRPGDRVVVHDPRANEMTLTDGVVTGVDIMKGVNGVGIRVGADRGETAVLWPSHLVVHRDPPDPTEPCWRCQELAERAAAPLREPSDQAMVGIDDALRSEPVLSLIRPMLTSA
jgi:hypothetical protein